MKEITLEKSILCQDFIDSFEHYRQRKNEMMVHEIAAIVELFDFLIKKGFTVSDKDDEDYDSGSDYIYLSHKEGRIVLLSRQKDLLTVELLFPRTDVWVEVECVDDLIKLFSNTCEIDR